MFTFATELVRFRLLSRMSYSHFLPGYLVLLLNPDLEARIAALATLTLKSWLEHLQSLELVAIFDQELKAWVDSLLFPELQWLREIMIRLLEADWRVAPAEVKEEFQIFGQPALHEAGRGRSQFHGRPCQAVQVWCHE